mgnify:CR=1 FL=1
MPMKPYPPAADGNENHLQCMRGRVNFKNADTTQVKIGALPAGAIVVGGGVNVITAFNATVSNTMDIGTTATADGYATLLDVSAKGYIVIDDLATHTMYSDTSEVVITARFNPGAADATAGVADVVIFYVTATPQ